jgi:hypothetical protein
LWPFLLAFMPMENKLSLLVLMSNTRG